MHIHIYTYIYSRLTRTPLRRPACADIPAINVINAIITICTGVYVCMYLCIYVCIYVFVYVCQYVCMYVCISAHTYAYMYAYVYVSKYVCNSSRLHVSQITSHGKVCAYIHVCLCVSMGDPLRLHTSHVSCRLLDNKSQQSNRNGIRNKSYQMFIL